MSENGSSYFNFRIATFLIYFLSKFQNIKFQNITASGPIEDYSPRWHVFPNGNYKMNISLTSETDPDIFSFALYAELRYHNRGYVF